LIQRNFIIVGFVSVFFMDKKLNNKGLDELNLAILQELLANARISNTEIGRRVGLSAPAVADRILKMEEAGVIQGSSIALDLDHIGLTIRAFISFKANNMTHIAMVNLFDSMPEIIEWHSVTGTASMLLKVAVATSKELEAVVEKLFLHGETTTSLILSGNIKPVSLRKNGAGH
jgi:Lrp/AsnC family transcriptional regulator, leucine-responsive regulatory protein